MKSKIVTFLSLIITSIFLTENTYAHGMNKHGPNGGFIQMPGTFHTELVENGKDFHVYLLDISFKNPMVEESKVSLKYKADKDFVVECRPEGNKFVCPKPKVGMDSLKEIIVTAKRDKSMGHDAVYKWPLKLAQPAPSAHSSH